MAEDKRDDSGNAEPAFTDAQKEELIRIVNGSHSTHHTRINKGIEQRFADLQTSMTESFGSMLDERLKAKPEEPSKGENGANGKPSGEVDVLRAEFEAKHKALAEKYEAERAARAQEAETNRINLERSKLASALSASGVDASRVRFAVAALHTEDKRVTTNKDGQIIFKTQREGYVDEQSLDEGVEEWLKSAEGKNFAPARDVSGSGATGGSTTRKPGEKPSRAELKQKLVAAIMRQEQGG